MIGFPTEGKDLPHQVFRPYCRFEDIFKVFLHERTVGNIIDRHLGEAHDCGENVVEVMVL